MPIWRPALQVQQPADPRRPDTGARKDGYGQAALLSRHHPGAGGCQRAGGFCQDLLTQEEIPRGGERVLVRHQQGPVHQARESRVQLFGEVGDRRLVAHRVARDRNRAPGFEGDAGRRISLRSRLELSEVAHEDVHDFVQVLVDPRIAEVFSDVLDYLVLGVRVRELGMMCPTAPRMKSVPWGTLVGPRLCGITVLAEAITDLGFLVPDWAEEPDEVLLGCGLPTALNYKGSLFEIGEQQRAFGLDGLNGSLMVLQASRQADALTRRGLSGWPLRFCFADVDRCLGSADRRVMPAGLR